MRAALAGATLALMVAGAPGAARADDDVGMKLMTLMMRCPAISADGAHVAIYSSDPGGEPGARTSVAVFGAGGALERRIAIVPPAVAADRAAAAATTISKLLDDGGYQRMGRVAKRATHFTSGDLDVTIDVAVAGRKVTIAGTRAGVALAPVTRALATKDGPCPAVDRYSIANTGAGYDAKSGLLAFSVAAEHGDAVCFAHDFVIALR